MARAYQRGRQQVAKIVSAQAKPEKGLKLPPPKQKPAKCQPEALPSYSLAPIPDKIYPATTLYDNTDILPGMVRREVGVVFLYRGSEFVVTHCNESNAKCVCLARQKRIITNGLTGETAEFLDAPGKLTVSNQIEPGDILRRINDAETFLSSKPRTIGQPKQTGTTETENMKTEKIILTDIDLLISKAIASKKDDTKIAAMCLANYPEVTPKAVVKLIAKYRKSATTPAAPVAKKEVKTAAAGSRAGSAAYVRGLFAAGEKKEDARAKTEKKFPDVVGFLFDRRWSTAEKLAKNSAPAKKAPTAKAPTPKAAPKKAAPAPKKVTASVPPPPKPVETPAEAPAAE